MIQNIIVLTIVFLAAAYAVWSIVKTLRIKSTGGCGDSCGCSAKTDIKKAILLKQKEINVDNLKIVRH